VNACATARAADALREQIRPTRAECAGTVSWYALLVNPSEQGRDWAVARASKVAYWRSLTPQERLRLADELRSHALLLHPDWPTAAQRAEDYEAHVHLCERLDRASSSRER
jgi:hypothetical protein